MSYELNILIKEIKNRYNLVEYIDSKGLAHHKKNGNRFFLCCPFHQEKTPSLCVTDKGIDSFFHCFGCGASGDVISFYAKYEKISIGKAINKLGKGIDINIDLSSIVKMLDKEKSEDSIEELNNYNIDVSRYLFSYLSIVRKKVSRDILKKEMLEVDSFYREFDSYVEKGDLEQVKIMYHKICETDFIQNRLSYFDSE